VIGKRGEIRFRRASGFRLVQMPNFEQISDSVRSMVDIEELTIASLCRLDEPAGPFLDSCFWVTGQPETVNPDMAYTLGNGETLS
jgi:hypothetical protein